MVRSEKDPCPKCGGSMKYYDYVIRTQKVIDGSPKKLILSRMKCVNCKSVHRVIPEGQTPYKQYSDQAIKDSLKNDIYDKGPSEATVNRWRSRKKHPPPIIDINY